VNIILEKDVSEKSKRMGVLNVKELIVADLI
jgi:hypothetical protein